MAHSYLHICCLAFGAASLEQRIQHQELPGTTTQAVDEELIHQSCPPCGVTGLRSLGLGTSSCPLSCGTCAPHSCWDTALGLPALPSPTPQLGPLSGLSSSVGRGGWEGKTGPAFPNPPPQTVLPTHPAFPTRRI